mgnify:CR=1 FL=1
MLVSVTRFFRVLCHRLFGGLKLRAWDDWRNGK